LMVPLFCSRNTSEFELSFKKGRKHGTKATVMFQRAIFVSTTGPTLRDIEYVHLPMCLWIGVRDGKRFTWTANVNI
jgi:hypothetical protein